MRIRMWSDFIGRLCFAFVGRFKFRIQPADGKLIISPWSTQSIECAKNHRSLAVIQSVLPRVWVSFGRLCCVANATRLLRHSNGWICTSSGNWRCNLLALGYPKRPRTSWHELWVSELVGSRLQHQPRAVMALPTLLTSVSMYVECSFTTLGLEASTRLAGAKWVWLDNLTVFQVQAITAMIMTRRHTGTRTIASSVIIV